MLDRHWTDEEMLNHLYGVGPEGMHLDLCQDCHARFHVLKERRRALVAEPEVPYGFLAAQRRAIYGRMEDPASPRFSLRFAPTVAAAAVMLFAVLLSRPVPEPESAATAVTGGGSQFYTEIYSTLYADSSLPRAAEPLQGLFDQ